MYNRINSVFFDDTKTFRHRIATATTAVTAAKSVHKRWEYLANSISSVSCSPFTLCVFILVLRFFFLNSFSVSSVCGHLFVYVSSRIFTTTKWTYFFFIYTIKARINFEFAFFLSDCDFFFVTSKKFLRFVYSNFLACILRFSNKERKKLFFGHSCHSAIVRRWYYHPKTTAKERKIQIFFSLLSHTTRFYFGVLSSFYCCCCTCIAAFFSLFVLCACLCVWSLSNSSISVTSPHNLTPKKCCIRWMKHQIRSFKKKN